VAGPDGAGAAGWPPHGGAGDGGRAGLAGVAGLDEPAVCGQSAAPHSETSSAGSGQLYWTVRPGWSVGHEGSGAGVAGPGLPPGACCGAAGLGWAGGAGCSGGSGAGRWPGRVTDLGGTDGAGVAR